MTGLALVALVILLLISFRPPIPGVGVLQSLRFHIVLPMLLLSALMLVQGARIRAVLLLAAILFSTGQGAMHIYNQQKSRWDLAAPVDADPVRVLSYNILAGNRRASDAVDYIIDSAPDIAVIMEAPGIQSYFSRLAEHYPYRAGCDDRATCDLAIFSRTPISRTIVEQLEFNRERLILIETEIRGRPLTVVGAHLTKPYFDGSASAELRKISRYLLWPEGPVVLAGDFNAAPWSDDIRMFLDRSDLVAAPFPYPATWPVRTGPLGLPIDNIFTKGGAIIQSIEAMSDPIGSNHRGLVADIGLPSP